MRIEQLKFFLMIANKQSISKAAQELYISQPALSESLRNLEKELGFPLVIRSKKGVSLTENGQEFIRYASEMNRIYTDMQNHFSQKKGVQAAEPQTIHLIMTPLYANTYAQQLIASFKDKYPHIEILYSEVPDDRFFDYLQKNNTLLGCILLYPDSLPEKEASLSRLVLEESRLMACAAPGSFSFAQSRISLDEVSLRPNIIFESSFSMKSFLNSDNIIVTNSVPMQIQAIMQKGYVGILPQSCYNRLYSAENIEAIPIDPVIPISNCVFYTNQEKLTEAGKLFLQHLQELFKDTSHGLAG